MDHSDDDDIIVHPPSPTWDRRPSTNMNTSSRKSLLCHPFLSKSFTFNKKNQRLCTISNEDLAQSSISPHRVDMMHFNKMPTLMRSEIYEIEESPTLAPKWEIKSHIIKDNVDLLMESFNLSKSHFFWCQYNWILVSVCQGSIGNDELIK